MQIISISFILKTLSILQLTFGFIEVDLNWITDEFIQAINQQTEGRWTAEKNIFVNYTILQLETLSNLRGYHPNSEFKPYTRRMDYLEMKDAPETFDARQQWPQCSSIGTIRDQGLCGADWAFAPAEVMSDRLCIASEGMVEFTFSAEELITCCYACGEGCQGGYLYPPFEYWKYNGIPSGGDEYKEEGCKPFTAMFGATPSCKRECRPGYNKSWEEDVRHGVSAYHVDTEVLQIQAEIMKHGPVAAAIDVYRDFYSYKEGVYDHISWDLVGHHAVKIVGWGVENGLPYWLLANSWGTGFGLNGFVKILRGANQCGIEYAVTAGMANNFE